MGKLIVTAWVTLDGYVAGPEDEMDWLMVDDQMYAYETDLVGESETLLLGRQTYLDFLDYWPNVKANPGAAAVEKAYAAKLNPLKKVVLSKRLKEADATWNDTTVWRDIRPDSIEQLKAESRKNILIYGSVTVAQQLINYDLVDELHMLVHPVLLGKGKLLLHDLDRRVELERIALEPFDSGVMKLIYRLATSRHLRQGGEPYRTEH